MAAVIMPQVTMLMLTNTPKKRSRERNPNTTVSASKYSFFPCHQVPSIQHSIIYVLYWFCVTWLHRPELINDQSINQYRLTASIPIRCWKLQLWTDCIYSHPTVWLGLAYKGVSRVQLQ